MMIKLTDKCSRGCIHCISDCTPKGKHMNYNTFLDAMNFQMKYGGFSLLISGGEPTEHPEFTEWIKMACDMMKAEYGRAASITVTTNGLWLCDNTPFVKMMARKYPECVFQVVVDDRYYPTHIDETNKAFTYSNVIICRGVERIYPQGRALTNNLPYDVKASKCFNVRALTKQLKGRSLLEILAYMNMRGYFCTPHIDINGNLLLGESSLCPPASSIYKSEAEILKDIESFQCHTCDFINENLPEEAKQFVM